MIHRRIQELHVARQIFKHDNIIVFRIYAQKRALPKKLEPFDNIYEFKVQTIPPYSCWLNGQYHHDMTDSKVAWSILLERVGTVSRQFGFGSYYGLLNWADDFKPKKETEE